MPDGSAAPVSSRKAPKATKAAQSSRKAPAAKTKPASPATTAGLDWNKPRGLLRRHLAKTPGASITGLARATGLDQPMLSRFLAEGSTKTLAVDSAAALAEHLQVTLDAFLAGGEDEGPSASRFLRVPLDAIEAGNNPRKLFDEAKLAELADSIAVDGLKTPLWVVAAGTRHAGEPGRYRLIAGERRLRAARLLAADKTRKAAFQAAFPGSRVPVQLYPADPVGEAVSAIVENVQREDLKGWELTAALQDLRDTHQLDGAAISRRTGLNERTVQQHLAIADRLPPELRQAYEAGDLSFTGARLAVSERREVEAPAGGADGAGEGAEGPTADAATDPNAEIAPPQLKTLEQGGGWSLEATYRSYADGSFGAELAIFHGDGEFARASGRRGVTMAAQSDAIEHLLDAVAGVLGDVESVEEAEALAAICQRLSTLTLVEATAAYLKKAAGELEAWGREDATPAATQREVLWEDAETGQRLAAETTRLGNAFACVVRATAPGFEAVGEALEDTEKEALAGAADAAGDQALLREPDVSLFGLFEALVRHSLDDWAMTRWLHAHAPAGWVSPDGRIKPAETVVALDDGGLYLAFDLAEGEDGWRAATAHRIQQSHGTTRPDLRTDNPAFPTREAAIAAAAATLAKLVARQSWHPPLRVAAMLTAIEPYLAEADKALAIPPETPATTAGAEPGSADDDKGPLAHLPTKGALLIAKRIKTHALRDAARKRQDVCKALVTLEVIRRYGGYDRALRIRRDEQMAPENHYSSPATAAVFAELAPALGDLVELERRNEHDHGRLQPKTNGYRDRDTDALLRALVALPADQLNRLFCAAVASQIVSLHGYDGAPGDDAEVVALAEILGVDVRHAWSDPAASEPEPYALSRDYLEGCSKATLQAIAGEVGAVKVAASTKKADAIAMILEHLETAGEARDWLPAPFHFATAEELPALGLGGPVRPRRTAADEAFDRDVRPLFLRRQDERAEDGDAEDGEGA